METQSGVCVPLLLALTAGCGPIDIDMPGDPTYEEIENCVKIADDWRARIGRAGADDWYHVKECSIDVREGRPTQVRVAVWSSLEPESDDCRDLSSALKSAVESRIESPVAVNASVVTRGFTCGSSSLFLFGSEDDSEDGH
ncbi:MAG: hypothetical protein OXP28_03710 [Gammaproteobacteria bacterium]|nr:hypothetical protein [Gammaproteobacteria bacterium]